MYCTGKNNFTRRFTEDSQSNAMNEGINVTSSMTRPLAEPMEGRTVGAAGEPRQLQDRDDPGRKGENRGQSKSRDISPTKEGIPWASAEGYDHLQKKLNKQYIYM